MPRGIPNKKSKLRAPWGSKKRLAALDVQVSERKSTPEPLAIDYRSRGPNGIDMQELQQNFNTARTDYVGAQLGLQKAKSELLDAEARFKRAQLELQVGHESIIN